MIYLCKGQKCQVQSATVIKIELVGLIDDRGVIDGCTCVRRRRTAVLPLLVGQYDPVQDAFFGGDIRDARGDA
jgi:hypothetical protein